MTTKPEENQTIDGFLRYDAFPSRSFKARGLEDPHFGKPIEVRGGNAKAVRSVAWSCDGKRVATGTEGKGLRVWEVRPGGGVEGTGAGLKTPHNGNVSAVAWSPTQPSILLSGCKTSNAGGVVAVWDTAASSSPLATFKLPGDVLHVAWHPSGEQFAAVCPRSTRDEVFFYWSRGGAWEQRHDIMIGGAGVDIGVVEINSLRFWKGGDAVLCVSNEGSLNAWWYPVEERAPLALSPTPEKEDPEEAKDDEPPAKKARLDTESQAASPEKEAEAEAAGEGDEEAAAQAEKSARDEEPEEGGEAAEADAAEEETPAAADEAEGEAAEGENAEGGADESEAKPEGADETADVTIEVTGADGAAATPKEDVDMSGAPTPAAASTAAPSPEPAAEAAAEPATGEEKEAAAKAAAARELERRKHKQLAPCFRQTVHPASLLALAMHPQGRYVAVGGQDARISLFTARDWLLERTFHQAEGAIRHLAFSRDGELLAVGGDDKVLHVLSVWTKATVARFPVAGVVNSLAWSPVRNTLAWSVNVKAGVVWYMASQENE